MQFAYASCKLFPSSDKSSNFTQGLYKKNLILSQPTYPILLNDKSNIYKFALKFISNYSELFYVILLFLKSYLFIVVFCLITFAKDKIY